MSKPINECKFQGRVSAVEAKTSGKGNVFYKIIVEIPGYQGAMMPLEVTAFGRSAGACKDLKRDDVVTVAGTLRGRAREAKNGQTYYSNEIIADEVRVEGPRATPPADDSDINW